MPFPNNGVKKIMKTEEFIITELKRRSSCQIESDCNSKSEKCKNDSGCCEKHPPNPFNFKAECGLLMGKASELIAKELAIRSYYESAEQGKIVIQRSHIQHAISSDDKFDFLIDVVPAKSTAEAKPRADVGSNEVNDEADPARQGGPTTVAHAVAQLEILNNIVHHQQQQQAHGHHNNSFSFSL